MKSVHCAMDSIAEDTKLEIQRMVREILDIDKVTEGVERVVALDSRHNALTNRVTDEHVRVWQHMHDIEADMDTRVRKIEKEAEAFQKRTLNQLNDLMEQVQGMKDKLGQIETQFSQAEQCMGPCTWEEHSNIECHFKTRIPCAKCLNVLAHKVDLRMVQVADAFTQVQTQIQQVHGRVTKQCGVTGCWFQTVREIRAEQAKESGYHEAHTNILLQLMMKMAKFEERLNGYAGAGSSSD